jgi:hypothetical protein
MRDFFFSTPWWVFVVVAAVAVFLLVSGNNRQDKTMKLAGLLVVLAGVILFLVSFFVETPPEITRRQTREFVQAVVGRDSAKLDSLLHANASILAWSKQDIIYGSKYYADQYGVKSAFCTSIDIEEHDSLVVSRLTVLSTHEGGNMPINTMTSTWELNWLQTSNGWKLKDITPIAVGQNELPRAKGHFQSKPPGAAK